MNFYILCLSFLVHIIKSNGQNGTLVYVNTTRGQVIGFRFDQGNDTTKVFHGQADLFLGLPFAVPPIGPLRYSKPQLIGQFIQNPYNATYYRSKCIQRGVKDDEMSEDCLNLNIYSPNVNSPTKYPVMVFIHGGGLEGGDNTMSFDGTTTNLISRGVVLVLLNYRLGYLGFFTTFTDDFPPNLGLLDQVIALKFIQEEISNFAGDPNQVTIFGQSAGATSVNAHTYSPLSQNLFHQAIQESGTVLLCFEDALGPTYHNFKFAQTACNYTIDMWNSANFGPLKNCLMNMNVSLGLELAARARGSIANSICWNMVQDNYFFPGTPASLWKSRVNKPVIVGTNKDEQALGVIYTILGGTNYTKFTRQWTEGSLQGSYANFFGQNKKKIISLLENAYIKHGIDDEDYLAWVQYMADIGTSFSFTAPEGQDIMYQLLNNNTNVYTYEFTYCARVSQPGYKYYAPGWCPVPHSAELPFVFQWGWDRYTADHIVNETDTALAKFFGESWTNFAKYGKPTLDNSWKPTTSAGLTTMEYMDISPNRGMKQGYRTVDRVTFNRILPLFVGYLPENIPDYNNGSLPLPTKLPYE